MAKKVEKHPQCNHKEMKCSSMDRLDGTCLLRNPFDCPFESKPEEITAEAIRAKTYKPGSRLLTPVEVEYLFDNLKGGQTVLTLNDIEELTENLNVLLLHTDYVVKAASINEAKNKQAIRECIESNTALTNDLLEAKDAECQKRIEQQEKYRSQLVADTNAQRTTECQERVERIFREAEQLCPHIKNFTKWQSLKKQEGVK